MRPLILILAPLIALTANDACIHVESTQVLASHLASRIPAFSGIPADTIIGYAPAPGLTRWWRGTELRRLAQRHGVDPGELAASCVERLARVVEQSEVSDALRQALPPGAQLEIADYCRMPVPAGKLVFELSGLARPAAPSSNSVLMWRGRLVYEQRRSVPFWASVRIAAERTGYYAARAVPAGKALETQDLTLETRSVSIFASEPEGSPDRLIGREVRRAIPAGAPLTQDLCAQPRDIMPGDTVSVVIQSGAARLSVEGRAAAGGRRGDEILIENRQNGKKFKATVEGKGRAAVNMENRNVEAVSDRTGPRAANQRRRQEAANAFAAGPHRPGS